MQFASGLALNRFALGARPGEFQHVEGGHQRCLKDQLQGPSRTPAVLADLRSVFKSVLIEHFGLPEYHVEETVFPGSAAVSPLAGLIRT